MVTRENNTPGNKLEGGPADVQSGGRGHYMHTNIVDNYAIKAAFSLTSHRTENSFISTR